MLKFTPLIAAISLTTLSSCTPPEVPPPHFRPNPPYAPDPVEPNGGTTEVPPGTMPSEPIPPPTATGGYPTARSTNNPDEVISPYEPYNVIDVAGFKSGQLARDPSNQKIFRVP